MAATNPRRTVAAVAVQTATGWPEADDGWTTQQDLIALHASEGAGQILGDAQLEQDTGYQVRANDTEAVTLGVVPNRNPLAGLGTLAGKWVRLLIEDTAGTTKIDGINHSPLWHGVIVRPTRAPDGAGDRRAAAGGRASWTCHGLADVLDRIYCWGGYEWHQDQVVETGLPLIFNDLAGGDRSTTTHDLNGSTVYLPERSAPGTPWRARDVIEFVLAAYANPRLPGTDGPGSGLRWVLGSGAALLAYEIERLDIAGHTVAQILNRLIHPGRGLTWRYTVSGSTVTITVTSTTRTAISIGGVTISAATPTVVDLTGNLWVDRPEIAEDTDWYDWIGVYGAKPWSAITLWYKVGDSASSLIPDGWTEADEPVDKDPSKDHVWRRFKINPEWIGQQYNLPGSGIANTIPYDETGTTGARTFGGPVPSPAGLEITRELPYGIGFTTTETGPRQKPLVIIGKDGTWSDWSRSIEISPADGKAGVMVGQDALIAKGLKGQLNGTGNTLLVTVGIREWQPLTVAWKRQGETPRDLPRVLVRREPSCEQWAGLEGTVSGVATGGATLTTKTFQMLRDDLGRLQGILALLVARYGGSGGSLSYRVDGSIVRSTTLAPGQMLDVDVGEGTQELGAIVTRRRWDFTLERFGTEISAERMPLDVESYA